MPVIENLCSSWKEKMISVSTDGTGHMTGRHSGAVSRIKRLASPRFYRLWCGAHQLGLFIQRVDRGCWTESFYSNLTGLIGYLRRQQILISDLQSTRPKVATTRCLSLRKVSSLLVWNRVKLLDYLAQKSPTCAPENCCWWILLSGVDEFMQHVDICFKALQGILTTVAQQYAYFRKLCDFCKLVRWQKVFQSPRASVLSVS